MNDWYPTDLTPPPTSDMEAVYRRFEEIYNRSVQPQPQAT